MKFITEGMAVELLEVHFGLSAPIAFEDVKKVYWAKSKLLHPDKGGSAEEFKAFSAAFDDLKQLYQAGSRLFDAEPMGEKKAGTYQRTSIPRVTVDGKPLCELGLGLGPTINGTDCKACDRRGYKVVEDRTPTDCQTCDGRGSYLHPKHGMRRCPTCYGSRKVIHAQPYVLVCHECHGTGEKRIYNPVIPKGRLTFDAQQDAA